MSALEKEKTKLKAIDIKKLCFSYSKDTSFIKNLSICLDAEKYYCIVGHNGSGKSTFSKLLTGLLKPKSGTIHIFDKSITKINYQKIFSFLGVVFQNPDSQFITSSIEEELAFGLENKKVPSKLMSKVVEELIEALNLESLKNKSPAILSGGQKQKIAIASVLAFNPALFLFDESSSLLSPAEKQQIVKLMKQLVVDYKKTVVSITHDMEELLQADEIIIFSKGKIVSHLKSSAELFRLPLSFFKELALTPPFSVQLGNSLTEKHSLDIPPFSSEEELISNIAQLKKRTFDWEKE
ncbi:ATP-binding cassette domain-containing protein [Mycoplasma suis]|uniref:Cobalt transporter ATP-binding protein CbiO n=2 Tax=Mycoplasma suis TaxID=57372 RepID=F0QR18_MYCSL|nr:ATP-binding cassette domain-containing protein [Mycoplasma suis]ADX97938.1 Cobalt transporter ATP-binding protein CbiO [Mycoplasma suis str. Illinois]CBZ40434.1 similar to ABC-type cobalt transporter [Mycoplasma suis KI3806]